MLTSIGHRARSGLGLGHTAGLGELLGQEDGGLPRQDGGLLGLAAGICCRVPSPAGRDHNVSVAVAVAVAVPVAVAVAVVLRRTGWTCNNSEGGSQLKQLA